MTIHKLSAWRNNEWVEHSYENNWDLETGDAYERAAVAPKDSHIQLPLELSQALLGPFGILYVLKVPRTGASAGRYQSPAPVDMNGLRAFMLGFEEYLQRDARHHIWVHCVTSNATLVYDNHNVLYLYGPVERFVAILSGKGYSQAKIRFPVPHAHNYHPEFDRAEKEILKHTQWIRTSLRTDDET